MIHPRTVTNFIWTVVVVAGVAAAVYFLLPVIGGWMNKGMNDRETMNRPSAIDLRDDLPKQ